MDSNQERAFQLCIWSSGEAGPQVAREHSESSIPP